MSVYPAPTRYPSIFNPTLFSNYSTDTYLSSADANATYAKLAGGQTIVAQETFTGGIKTDTIAQYSGPLTILGNITQPSGYLTTLRTTTINGTLGCTRLLSQGTSQASSFAGDVNCSANVSVIGNLSLGTPIIRGGSWTASAATTHTITSTDLPYLAQNNWTGELKIFADDASSYGGIMTYYLVRYTDTLSITQVATSKFTNMSTFDATASTVAGSSTITVTAKRTSTDTTGTRISWLFTGAL